MCGSYRRGRATCGDIDILISHPDNRSHYGFLITLLDRLKERKLITNDLITVQKDEQRKYMGLIKLPGDNRKVRVIILIIKFTYSCNFQKLMSYFQLYFCQ